MQSQLYPKDGPVLRDKIKMQQLKGHAPTQPIGLQHRAPVAEVDGILSGQAMVHDASGEWVLAQSGVGNSAENAILTTVYFPLSDSFDHDVQAAGALPGLSSSGDYELQIAYFDTGTNFEIGTELAVSDANPGNLKVAGSGDIVVGKITAIGDEADGSINLKGQHSSAKVDGLKVIQFATVQAYAKA